MAEEGGGALEVSFSSEATFPNENPVESDLSCLEESEKEKAGFGGSSVVLEALEGDLSVKFNE